MARHVVPQPLAMERPPRPTELMQLYALLLASRTHLVPEVTRDESVGGGNAPGHPVALEETIRLQTDRKTFIRKIRETCNNLTIPFL